VADTVQTLLVSLEARIAGYEREMKRAVGVSNRSAKGIEDRFKRMNGVVEGAFGKIAAVYASAQFLRGASTLIDANTRVQNSLKVAGLEGQALTQVYDQLFASAQRNAAPIEDLVTLYSRASQSAADLGVSQEQLLKFTDNVALSLRVGGKSAQEASGALLQLSQVLGGGVVQAEEYNSLIDGAQPLLQAVANGMVEAGGSVAALTRLVKDGKVSSKAFFDAFEAGAGILTDKVAGSELTVSQSFVRLQNVLQDVAGKFNEGTGAGQSFALFIADLSSRILIAGDNFEQGITPIQRFLRAIQDVSRAAGQRVGADNIGKAIIESLEDSNDTIAATEVALTDAEQALATFALNSKGRFGELQPVVDDFVQQLLEGKGNAELATVAINEIGSAGDFGGLIGSLGSLVTNLFAVRDAAVAARQAAEFSDIGSFPSQSEFNSGLGIPVTPAKPKITLEDPQYSIPGKGGGKSGGGKSKADTFGDALDKQAEENRLLTEKTALQATLNPLVNDYGMAMERLNVQQDLLAAATAAGIAITPELKATIDDLALGYASATVEAAKLAETQENAQQSMVEWFDLGKSAARGFIDDLIAGKSAAEALGNVFSQLGSKLIDLGLDSLFGRGGGDFGSIGKLFGFAGGGYTGNGGRNEPAGIVHRGEWVMTKQQTARIGVGNLSRLAKGYASGGLVGSPGPVSRVAASSSGASISMPITIDATGADAAGLARVEQRLAALQAELPSRIKHVVSRRSKDIW